METKVCNRCKIEKILNEYRKDIRCRDGVKNPCKSCAKAYNNSPKMKIYRSEWYQDFLLKNPKKIKIRIKKEIDIDKQMGNKKISQKRYSDKNKEKIAKRMKEYHTKNANKYREYQREFVKKNKEKRNKKIREYKKNRRKTDPLYKLANDLRVRIGGCLKKSNHKKTSKTHEILGVSFDTVKLHLEHRFKKGMNWSNHGKGGNKWHIDHKIPLSSAKTEKELFLLFHYTNLQPLWENENIKKSNKITPTQMILTI